MQLLLIDGAQGNGELLAQRLSAFGFRPRLVTNEVEALDSFKRNDFHAVLLDHGRRAESTALAIASLRLGGMTQPILVISARDDWREKVDCLDAGADDFVVKPVRSEEIAARLRALIRRCAGVTTGRIIHGDIDLDLKQQCAWKAGKCLNLTRNEFRLLRLFLLGPDQVLGKNQIRDAMRGPGAALSDNAIEVQVARLRRKLGEASILTLRGLGYRILAEGSNDGAIASRNPCRSESTGADVTRARETALPDVPRGDDACVQLRTLPRNSANAVEPVGADINR